MKNTAVFIMSIVIGFHVQAYALGGDGGSMRDRRPNLPWIAAEEVYVRFKAGKGLLVQAAETSNPEKHVLGSISINLKDVKQGKASLPQVPKDTELYIYCY